MLVTRFRISLVSLLLIVPLTACTGNVINKLEGQYWQRTSVSEAAYIQGPKAQQMLSRDISRCVFELRELERLGMIKNAIPTDHHGRVLDPDELAMKDWDTPERDGHLLSEHGDYMDFETCMRDKGWERIEHVPYDVAEKGRENYVRTNIKYRDAVKAADSDKTTVDGQSENIGKLNN